MLRCIIVGLLLFVPAIATADEPVALGDRLELFADGFLIDRQSGDVALRVHQPEPAEVALTADEPWEGNTSGYFTLFEDGERYRMIYRGWQHDPDDIRHEIHPEVVCLAESDDGIHWQKPNLGIVEFAGSTDNNIIWDGEGSHNFTPFKDMNPACSADARYKALGRTKGGLIYFKSPDGVHWEIAHDEPVITDGAFDSQNLAFWDPYEKEYRAYWRIFTDGVRAIRTATSDDFVHWRPHADLTYAEGTPNQHLYTNAVQKYFRAPHLFVGFPTRFLPDEGQRVEPIFMISRDGVDFVRYNEPVVPETAPADRQGNRSNYMTWGMLALPERPDEISVYATEAYYGPVPGRVRRFAYRLDGFVSLRAGADGGEIVTRPITFSGSELVLNYQADAGGGVSVEILDEAGEPIDGFTSSDADRLEGDSVRGVVSWNGSSDLSKLAGKPIRLRIDAKDADIYSLRFQ
ncbi:MAG: hypothetical protein KDA63_19760 [Planctomycetales bacterium]|nr:hypothetical protein [Planctomycetales bacterium]